MSEALENFMKRWQKQTQNPYIRDLTLGTPLATSPNLQQRRDMQITDFMQTNGQFLPTPSRAIRPDLNPLNRPSTAPLYSRTNCSSLEELAGFLKATNQAFMESHHRNL